MRHVTVTADTAAFEILVTAAALVMRTAVDCSIFGVAGRADLTVVRRLTHEQTGLVERPVGRVDVA